MSTFYLAKIITGYIDNALKDTFLHNVTVREREGLILARNCIVIDGLLCSEGHNILFRVG